MNRPWHSSKRGCARLRRALFFCPATPHRRGRHCLRMILLSGAEEAVDLFGFVVTGRARSLVSFVRAPWSDNLASLSATGR